MTGMTLIVPAAGRGSRFQRAGVSEPKPLIDLMGRPFFWWATESVRRALPVGRMVFVILEEHDRRFAIAARIRKHYPDAEIVAVPEVTSGAAETARLGLDTDMNREPIIINDCDHAFTFSQPIRTAEGFLGDAAGALLCFRSGNSAYSYACLDQAGQVSGTVEKEVVSSFAIAGCYVFASAQVFTKAYEAYRRDCPYQELFVSGLYNVLLGQGARVSMMELQHHLSFGTPEERNAITPGALNRIGNWQLV